MTNNDGVSKQIYNQPILEKKCKKIHFLWKILINIRLVSKPASVQTSFLMVIKNVVVNLVFVFIRRKSHDCSF